MKRSFLILFITLFAVGSISADTGIIAHRGFSAKAPENTLAAFKKAIRSGADYFELDVHKTADDSVVVIHDGTIDRVCSNGMTGAIADMSFAEIQAVRVAYPDKFGKRFKNEGIPTLKEALTCAKGRIKVCIEIKAHDVEAAVLKAVNDLDMNNDVIIFSFYYDVLENMRTLDPVIPLLYLRSDADSKTLAMVEDLPGQAIGVGLKTKITPEFLDRAHQKGLEVWQWTVNEPCEMEALLELGVDGIITNHPDKALKLRRHNKNSK